MYMKTLGYFKNVSRIYPWISGPTMNSVVQSMVQTFPVSEEKKIGGPGSMIHKRWISGLGHEFSSQVHGPDHSCLRRKKYGSKSVICGP